MFIKWSQACDISDDGPHKAAVPGGRRLQLRDGGVELEYDLATAQQDGHMQY